MCKEEIKRLEHHYHIWKGNQYISEQARQTNLLELIYLQLKALNERSETNG